MESIFPSNYFTFIFKFLYKTVFEPFLSSRDAYASVVPFVVLQHKTVVRAKRNGSFVQVSLSSSVIETDYIVCEVQERETRLYRPHLVIFKYAQLIRVAEVWKHLTL
jgi:hypothetical protein